MQTLKDFFIFEHLICAYSRILGKAKKERIFNSPSMGKEEVAASAATAEYEKISDFILPKIKSYLLFFL